MSPQDVESFRQVINIESSFLALHKHIIDVDLHVVINLIFEDFVDQPLIYSPGIFETKRYDFIAVQAFVGDEHHLLLVLWCHPDLVVVGEGIYEAEQLMV